MWLLELFFWGGGGRWHCGDLYWIEQRGHHLVDINCYKEYTRGTRGVSSRSIFYPSFSNTLPSFHTFLHTMQDETNQTQYIVQDSTSQDYKTPDLRLVLLCDFRSPTETAYAVEILHPRLGFLISFPQDKSSAEEPFLGSAGRVNQGVGTLLSGGTKISPT